MKRLYSLFTICAVVVFASSAVAGSYDDAKAAYDRHDFSMALTLLQPLVREGNASAQFDLGRMYYFGWGVAQDYTEAMRLYALAASQGNALGQNALGMIYEYGQGGAQNYTEAVRLYKLAADQGLAAAQNNLGKMYENGWGVAQNYTEALRLYKLAADQGLVEQGWHVAGNNFARLSTIVARSKQTVSPPPNSVAATPPAPVVNPVPTRPIANAAPTRSFEVPLKRQGSILVVPVLINNQITLDFVLDSGATDVSIPADVFLTLVRTKTITSADFLGHKTYVLADGTTVPSQTVRIRSLKVGGRVLENVTAGISSVQGQLLLGQSFLQRFKSWSIDNTRQVLMLD